MKKILFGSVVFISFITATQSCDKESNSVNKTFSNPADAQPAPTVVSDSGLICYLKFDHNLKDSSGNGNNGALKNGTITYVADRSGHARSALSLAGTSAYIEIPEAQIDGLTKGSISLDFYPTEATGATEVIMSKMSYAIPEGSSGFYQSIVNAYSSTSNLGFSIRENGDCDATAGTGWDNVTSDAAFTLNAWNNEVIEFNNTVEKLFLNGKLVSTIAKSTTPICSGEPLRLGVWWSQDPSHFNGYLDEFRIYTRTLSTGEIKQLAKQ